jgi:hypothetical protein
MWLLLFRLVCRTSDAREYAVMSSLLVDRNIDATLTAANCSCTPAAASVAIAAVYQSDMCYDVERYCFVKSGQYQNLITPSTLLEEPAAVVACT